MEEKHMPEIRVGEFLVENNIISEKELADALDMQQHNPERLLGEILVTQGIMSKEDLIMAMEMYLVLTDAQPVHVDEWLDQDEVDILLKKLQDNQDGVE